MIYEISILLHEQFFQEYFQGDDDNHTCKYIVVLTSLLVVMGFQLYLLVIMKLNPYPNENVSSEYLLIPIQCLVIRLCFFELLSPNMSNCIIIQNCIQNKCVFYRF